MTLHAIVTALGLFALGASAGIVGTLVGLGGGFIIVPILRLVYLLAPAEAAGISLVMVLANAASGSVAYVKQRRADVRTAVLVAAAGIPASLIGARLVHFVSRAFFDLVFGLVLAYFFYVTMRRRRSGGAEKPLVRGLVERTHVDRDGRSFTYGTSVPLVLATGALLGFSSAFLGIGGGIIFVLVFIGLFRMPPHVVSATSTLAILLTSPAGVITHALQNDIVWSYAAPLALGGLAGGQIGPRIGKRISSPRLLDVMAFAIVIAASALILKHVPIGR